MLAFAQREPLCLERECLEGHFTASAFVISPDHSSAVLIKHRKLNKWLQPGGHADGSDNLRATAKLEVTQETGLEDLDEVDGTVFDLDIHHIPQYREVQPHLHYDVRFLFRSRQWELERNNEAEDIRWVPLTEVAAWSCEESILRMTRKALATLQSDRSSHAADTSA
ncbi:MAG: NUDIX hydrolase [Bdellovibrionales bacterium]|nr:NUDIX hydrolase [Bdellovibrionales bacterium]